MSDSREVTSCHFERSALGPQLSAEACRQLASLATRRRLAPGEVLFTEGAENHDVFVLLEGEIDLSMTVPGRGAVRVLSLGEGDVVAWSALLGDGVMTCGARARVASEILVLPAQMLRTVLEHAPALGYEFMRALASTLARRLTATRLQLLDLFEGAAARAPS